MGSSQDQWQLIENEKKNERICSVCGKTHQTHCVLRTEHGLICTKCLLNKSDEIIRQDSLSGSYTFITNEIDNADYNDYLDSAEDEINALDLEEGDE